ncbi:hypothetical protein GJ496_004998 [Pomphorhynchus laevis]|nr:hypothetical protein GJ496_004998 [Pomphorhynchus laevis]
MGFCEEVAELAESNEWSKCLAVCMKAQSKIKEEEELTFIQHSIIVCYLKLSEFTRASREIRQYREDKFCFERAYLLYKLGQYEELKPVLKNCRDDNDYRGQVIGSQMMYKLGFYHESSKLLDNLILQNYDDGILSNFLANLVHLTLTKLPLTDVQIDNIYKSKNVDIISNYVILMLNMEDFSSVDLCLQRAQEIIDGDKNCEPNFRARILILRAISLHLQSKYTDATEIYKQALQCSSDSKADSTLIRLNLFLCNENAPEIDAKFVRKYKTLISKITKLSKPQELCNIYNEAFMNLSTNNKDVELQTAKFPLFPLHNRYFDKIKTYSLLSKHQFSEALSQPALDTYQRAKILAIQGSYSQAAALLESSEYNATWAIVICDLYLKVNDLNSIKQYLNSVEKIGDDQLSAKLSRYLIRHNLIRHDEHLLSKLKALVQLPTLNELCDGLTIDEVYMTLRLSTITLDRKHKKKRKNKPAKDIGKPLDLERWIPMKERSYYKSFRRRIKQQTTAKKTMQGGVISEAGVECEHWVGDKYNKPSIQNKQESSATAAVKKPPGSNPPGKSGRSKRKRKEKW